MIVKRFRAANMQSALEMVKKELGDEAVILKSETVARKGVRDVGRKPEVEVVAAVDSMPVKAAPKPNIGGSTGYFARQEARADAGAFASLLSGDLAELARHASGDKAKQPGVSKQSKPRPKTAKERPAMNGKEAVRDAEQDSKMKILMNEVNELRSMVNSMTTRIGHIQSEYSLREFADLPAPYAEQVMNLMQTGIDNQIARSLVDKTAASLPVDSVHNTEMLKTAIVEQIARLIKVAGPITCQKGRARVIALVGPTGSGKTSTLAKLAANSKFVFNKNVALITADTHRVSALEHLNTFAGISQLPLSAVYSPDELKSALQAQQDKDLIFIDTAGRSPRDEPHLLEMRQFLDMAGPAEVHLVLPASLHHIDMLETLRRFAVLNFNRVIISKSDETSALGNMLNIAVESEHPVSYITTGQTIPDDIELANAERMARMIMRTL